MRQDGSEQLRTHRIRATRVSRRGFRCQEAQRCGCEAAAIHRARKGAFPDMPWVLGLRFRILRCILELLSDTVCRNSRIEGRFRDGFTLFDDLSSWGSWTRQIQRGRSMPSPCIYIPDTKALETRPLARACSTPLDRFSPKARALGQENPRLNLGSPRRQVALALSAPCLRT